MARPTTYTLDELVLAYELWKEGCNLKLVARSLGLNPMTLSAAFHRAEVHGIGWVKV